MATTGWIETTSLLNVQRMVSVSEALTALYESGPSEWRVIHSSVFCLFGATVSSPQVRETETCIFGRCMMTY